MLPKNKKAKIVVSAFALSALSTFALSTGANATSTNFPDENFYYCVMDAYYYGSQPVELLQQSFKANGLRGGIEDEEMEDESEELTPEQLASITFLDCEIHSTSRLRGIGLEDDLRKLTMRGIESDEEDYLIHDLTGIELLTNLQYAYLGGNAVTAVDLSDNTNLEFFDLSNNNISSVTLPETESLREFSLADNNLASINLSVASNLTYLDLAGNNLTSVDFTQNPLLQVAYVDENNLGSVDLYNNPYLFAFSALDNPELPYIDFSNNPLVDYFWSGQTPVYLGNKAFVDEDGEIKVRLTNLIFDEDAVVVPDDSYYAPALGGESITGLPDIDEPVSPELIFISIEESDEYHVEIEDDGTRVVIFENVDANTSNILNLTSTEGSYRLIVNLAEVRDETEEEEEAPAVPNTGIFTNEETGRELGAVALALAIASSISFVVISIVNRIRKHNSVRKF